MRVKFFVNVADFEKFQEGKIVVLGFLPVLAQVEISANADEVEIFRGEKAFMVQKKSAVKPERTPRSSFPS